VKKNYLKHFLNQKYFYLFSLRGNWYSTNRGSFVCNKVIGYDGGGGSTYWKKPLFTKIENGEIGDFGQKIIQNIKNYNLSWIKETSKQRRNLSKLYSPELEKKSLMLLSNKILNLFK